MSTFFISESIKSYDVNNLFVIILYVRHIFMEYEFSCR